MNHQITLNQLRADMVWDFRVVILVLTLMFLTLFLAIMSRGE